MKKNFLKKLAFTMAFATAFTALSPAAGVFAAAKPSLTVGKTLTLLLGTEREEHDINVKNKVAGSKYAWSTSNKAIATVDSKGVVEGQKVGSAKVTLKITLPTKKTQTLTTNVDVKDNIKEVAINNAPTEALKVGQEHDFNRTIVSTFGGNTKAHKGAITRWEVKDAEGKATETATIDETGVFVATEAGKYTVEAISFQSKAKYADYLKTANQDLVTARSAAAEVEVKASLTGVKQVDLTTAEVTFNGAVEDASKIEVFAVAGTARVKQIVKEVKFDDAKKVAKVTLFVPFTATTTYVVAAEGLGEGSFVAATQNVEDVASIEVTTKEAVVNKETEVKVKLLNADGVDITTDALLARVTLASSSDRAFLNGNKLTMTTLGDVTNITAKFHTYEYDSEGKEIIKVQTVAPIVCVATPSVIAGAINAYTVVKANPNFAADKVNHRLAVKDGGYKLFVEATKNDAAKTKVNNNNNDGLFTFDSSNPSILIVSTTGDLTPVAQGSVQVIVKYDNAIIGTVTITVVAERTAVSITASEPRLTLSNAIHEPKNVTVEVKDQLGAGLDLANVRVEKLSGGNNGPVVESVLTTNSDGKATIVVSAGGKDVGSYTYKLSTGNVVTTFVVTVVAPSGNLSSRQRLDVSATEVDMAIKAGDTTKKVTFNIYDVAANGVDSANVTSGTTYEIEVTNPKGVVTTGAEFNLVKTDATKYIKDETGRYTVKAYKLKADGSRDSIVDVKYFTVKDTQKAPTLTSVKGLVATTRNLQSAIRELLEIKMDNFQYLDGNFTVSYAGTTSTNPNVQITDPSVFIYSITVEQDIDGKILHHKVNIDRLIQFN